MVLIGHKLNPWALRDKGRSLRWSAPNLSRVDIVPTTLCYLACLDVAVV